MELASVHELSESIKLVAEQMQLVKVCAIVGFILGYVLGRVR